MRHHISEEQAAEIEKARRKNKDKNKEKRMTVLVLHAQGEKRSDIAEQTGFVTSHISKIVSKYCKYGLSAIIGNHYQGNRRNLTFEEETELLKPFKEAAANGRMVEISAIKAAYEEMTGKSLDNNHGQIYRVLKRHGWRKVMPRSKHPNKASDEVIEASKKLTNLSEQSRWEILQVEKSD